VTTTTARVCSSAFLLGLAILVGACGEEGLLPTTVDPGADFSIADLVFEEAFFYCQVEPRAIAASRCGPGDPGQGDATNGCHYSVTSFRLTEYAPLVADGCNGNVPTTPIPTPARLNYQTAQARMKRDPNSAPLLQRPLQRLEHPRRIFDENSDAAAVIREWANRVTTQ
jgi:hypothetical protein